MNFIPYGTQCIEEEEIEAVTDVLRSSYLTQGPVTDAFEYTVASYCGVKEAVAVCNATAALHLACKALDVQPGDVVWTSPNTFVASANCALYCGAGIDFVDICPETYNLSVDSLQEKLVIADKHGCLPKVVIPVHFAGQSCDMKNIRQLADKYGFKIIEDASHAIGGRYLNQPIGACEYSDITIFSFHAVKVMTTAEGGMCLTNNTKLAEKIKRYRTHGITRDPNLMTKPSEGAWYYQQLDLGMNYRITEIQCALGIAQMKKLDKFVERRHHLAWQYYQALKALPITLPMMDEACYSAYHLYVVQVSEVGTCDRKQVFDYLRSKHIGVNVHYSPVHLQPYYAQYGFKEGDFPVAEAYYRRTLTLPLYPGLTESQQTFVIKTLQEAIDGLV